MAKRRTRGDGGLTQRGCSIDGCARPHDAQGYCHIHYGRAKRRGLIDNVPSKTLEQRFWDKVDTTGDCWLWTASIRNGYGLFNLSAGDTQYAHRLAYQWLVGPIPDGMQLDHLCRNRPCCNPAHLEPVEPRENYRRGYGFSGINHRKTHCPDGHEYDLANTYIDARGQRHCRACRRRRGREYRRRNRAQAA